MSEEKEIPKGWAKVTISELISGDGVFVDGDWIESKDQDPNGSVRLIQLADIGDGEFRNKSNRFLTIERAKELNCTFLREGDILVARMPDPIGRACIFPLKGDEKFITAVDVAIIRLGHNSIENKFLVHSLNNRKIRNEIENLQSGTTRKRISRANLGTIKFPLPPLPEQHRIVAKIEELFSSLDKGIEGLKKAQEQLKIYRQAVLKWAFEGKLSKSYRDRHISPSASKDELRAVRKEREIWFKSIGKKLKYDFELKEETLTKIPTEWEWVKIVETVFNTADDIVDGPFGSNLKNSDYVEGAPVPVISISNIEEGFDKKIRYITKEKFETIKRSAVYPGDIIVAKIGSTYGKTGFYPETMPIGVIPANLLRVHPSKHFNYKLLAHYLQSLVFKKRLDKIMKSTAQPAFNVSMFKELPIPFMSLKEQEYILSEIESRLSVCDKIEESISAALQQAEALRQSILKKAFEGKLVPQDPNDEPASILVERIRKERVKIFQLKKQKTYKRNIKTKKD